MVTNISTTCEPRKTVHFQLRTCLNYRAADEKGRNAQGKEARSDCKCSLWTRLEGHVVLHGRGMDARPGCSLCTYAKTDKDSPSARSRGSAHSKDVRYCRWKGAPFRFLVYTQPSCRDPFSTYPNWDSLPSLPLLDITNCEPELNQHRGRWPGGVMSSTKWPKAR